MNVALSLNDKEPIRKQSCKISQSQKEAMLKRAVIMEKDSFVLVFIAFAWMLIMVSYVLLKQHKSGNRRWWMLPDKRERHHLGVYTTLFLKYKRTNHEEFFKMTRLTVEQFDDLLNLVSPALIKSSMREFLDPEFRLAFIVWWVMLSY